MKRFLHIVLLVAILASCARLDPEPEGQIPASLVQELGLDEPEMPVRLGFDLPGEQPLDPTTKASLVGGVEDPAEYVKSLHMACFTKEGIYLGYRVANLIEDEREFNHDGLPGA